MGVSVLIALSCKQSHLKASGWPLKLRLEAVRLVPWRALENCSDIVLIILFLN